MKPSNKQYDKFANDPLFNDLIVQICFDSDRLDIGRAGYVVDPAYLATGYAKSLVNHT